MFFSFFCYEFPLQKDKVLHMNKFESPLPKDAFPFTQGCFVLSLVEISPVVLEKKMKCEKFTDRQTNRQQVIRKAHLSFQFRWVYKVWAP